jgi:hypothetical protein
MHEFQAIIGESGIDVSISLSAMLCVKNFCHRYWRRRPEADGHIPEEEKSEIREALLNMLHLPVPDILAVHIAVTIADIARSDFPKQWPNLLDVLSSNIQTTSELMLVRRSQTTLYHVVKVLASKMLPADRQQFRSIAPSLMVFAMERWRMLCGSLGEMTATSGWLLSPDIVQDLILSLKLFKRLLKSMPFGQLHSTTQGTVLEFITHGLRFFGSGAEFCVVTNDGRTAGVQKLLLVMGKLWWMGLQTESLVSALEDCGHLEGVIHFFFVTLHKYSNVPAIGERASAMLFYCCREMTNFAGANDDNLWKRHLRQVVFPPNSALLGNFVSTIIKHHLILTEDDWLLWHDDPCAFVLMEDADASSEILRAVCESFLLSLVSCFRSETPKILLETLAAIQNTWEQNSASLQCSLELDAILRVVSSASFECAEVWDAYQWISAFSQQLTSRNGLPLECQQLLYRRLSLMMGAFVIAMPNDAATRCLVYSWLLQGLDESFDLVIRISCASALAVLVNDLTFSAALFEPYLGAFLERCISLLQTGLVPELTRMVLDLISDIVSIKSPAVSKLLPLLDSLLQSVWTYAIQNEVMHVAAATLRCSKAICGSLDTQLTLPVLLRMLSFVMVAADLNNSFSLMLVEEGLELWEAVVIVFQTWEAGASTLLELFLRLIPSLSTDSSYDYVLPCMRLTESYALLGGSAFLGHPAVQVLLSATLGVLLPEVNDRALLACLESLEICLCADIQNAAPALLYPGFARLLSELVQKEGEGIRLAATWTVCSRIILSDMQQFQQLCTTLAPGAESSFLERLFLAATGSLDMTRPSGVRQSVIGLLHFLQLPFPWVLQHMELFFDIAIRGMNESHTLQYLFATEREPSDSEDESDAGGNGEAHRRMVSTLADRFHRIDIRQFMMEQLQCCQKLQHPEHFNQAMQQINPTLSAPFQMTLPSS